MVSVSVSYDYGIARKAEAKVCNDEMICITMTHGIDVMMKVISLSKRGRMHELMHHHESQ